MSIWKTYGTIFYEFQNCLHDKNKITKLFDKCGWELKNNNKHKKYTRETPRGNKQIIICPSSPNTSNEWKRVWCELKKYQIELIKEVI